MKRKRQYRRSRDQGRNKILPEIMARLFRQVMVSRQLVVLYLGTKNINARGHERFFGVTRNGFRISRFFNELSDPLIFTHRHNATGGGLSDGNFYTADRDVGALLHMCRQDRKSVV